MKRLVFRVMALSIPAAVPLAVWLIAVRPVVSYRFGLQDTLDADRFELARLDKASGRLSAAEQRLAVAKAAVSREQGWLQGSNNEQCAAFLQTMVKRAVEIHGGVLQSIQVLPPAAEDAVTQIGIRVEGAISYNDLVPVLLEFEQLRSPRIWVSDLDMRVTDTGSRLVSSSVPTQKISLQMSVVGYSPPREGAR
jgi:hypothetical protein